MSVLLREVQVRLHFVNRCWRCFVVLVLVLVLAAAAAAAAAVGVVCVVCTSISSVLQVAMRLQGLPNDHTDLCSSRLKNFFSDAVKLQAKCSSLYRVRSTN